MIRAAPSAGSFPVGWYGKIPGTGDFIARRMPARFSETWDAWLQQAMDGCRERLGSHWRDAFLTMPPWRFVLSPGLATDAAWAGLMVPSVDAVGRYFPLTLASPLPRASLNLAATLLAATPWFEALETIALTAIVPKADTSAIDRELVGLPFRGEWLRPAEDNSDSTRPIPGSTPQMLALPLPARAPLPELNEMQGRLCEPCAAWLAEASEVFGRTLLLSEGLPPAEQFCGMMEGAWATHGWSRRDLRGAA